MPRNVRIGIIGTGFGGAVQLPGFQSLPNAEVIGIASRNSKKANALAGQYGLPRRFASPAELIACAEIDLLSITTPQETHADLLHDVIGAGKAVLTEKPLTLSSQDASAMLELATKQRVFHAVDFEFRFSESWRFFRDAVKKGTVGTVTGAEFRWITGSWADPMRPFGWHSQRERGGGVLSALGSHLFDAMEWILGPAVSVEATTGITVTARHDAEGVRREVTAEDHASARFTFERGIEATVELSNVDPDGAGLSMVVYGDCGTLTLASTSREYGRGEHVTLRTSDGTTETLFSGGVQGSGDPRITLFSTFAAGMIDAYQNDTSFSPSLREGYRARLLQDAVLRSNGSRVDIGKGST